MLTDTRELAHELIDRLPEAQVVGLVRFLEAIIDPTTAALRNAPFDEEPETDEDQLAVAEARDWLRMNGGQGIPHTEAMRRLSLE